METDKEIAYLDPRESPGLQLWWASNALLRTIRKAIEPLGLTHAQLILLANLDYLTQEEEVVTQRMLCRFSTMDENMVSQVVRSLLRKGVVSRTPHPTDRRAHRLQVTGAGHRLLASALALSRPATQSFFARLGDSRQQLISLLRKLNEAGGE